jgi:hypothetical protein
MPFQPIPVVHPLLAALDKNRDGTISAEEINNAVAALKKIDKDGSGALEPPELIPHPPVMPPGQPGVQPGQPNVQGQQNSGTDRPNLRPNRRMPRQPGNQQAPNPDSLNNPPPENPDGSPAGTGF